MSGVSGRYIPEVPEKNLGLGNNKTTKKYWVPMMYQALDLTTYFDWLQTHWFPEYIHSLIPCVFYHSSRVHL